MDDRTTKQYPYKTLKLPDGSTRGEHRCVVERHIGRRLQRNECVHHIDFNSRNNDLTNLIVMSLSEHMRFHLWRGDIPRVALTEDGRRRLVEHSSSIHESIARRIKFGSDTPKELNKIYGVSKHIVSDIRRGKSWRHLVVE